MNRQGKSNLRKFNLLNHLLKRCSKQSQKKRKLLEMVAQGFDDAALTSMANKKIFEIELAEKLLSPLLALNSAARDPDGDDSNYNAEQIEALRLLVKKKR